MPSLLLITLIWTIISIPVAFFLGAMFRLVNRPVLYYRD